MTVTAFRDLSAFNLLALGVSAGVRVWKARSVLPTSIPSLPPNTPVPSGSWGENQRTAPPGTRAFRASGAALAPGGGSAGQARPARPRGGAAAPQPPAAPAPLSALPAARTPSPPPQARSPSHLPAPAGPPAAALRRRVSRSRLPPGRQPAPPPGGGRHVTPPPRSSPRPTPRPRPASRPPGRHRRNDATRGVLCRRRRRAAGSVGGGAWRLLPGRDGEVRSGKMWGSRGKRGR